MNADMLAAELVRDEDIRLKPYRDIRGKLTIGVGRNLDDEGITREEAMMLLRNDIAGRLGDLDRHIPWWRRLDEVRQLVLADMCFNLGIERLLGFRKMLAALQLGDFETAAEEMAASQWDHEVKDRAVRLVAMMRTGKTEAI